MSIYDIYNKYLVTPRKNYQDLVVRPAKGYIVKAMNRIHLLKNEQSTIENLINEQIKNNGKIYFWSDLHLNHFNILKHANRKFHSINEMNNFIVSNYYNTITNNDIVIFGGDIAFGDVTEIKNILKDFPGIKILVLGNHDFDKNKAIFRDYGFDLTCMCFEFDYTYNQQMYHFYVTHYPLDLLYVPGDNFNIHGHIHQYLGHHKNINMAVEHLNYSPCELNSLISKHFLNYSQIIS